MSEANDHQPFPLFKGACRLPTVFGIPRSIVIYLGVGRRDAVFVYQVLRAPLHSVGVCYLLVSDALR